MSILDSIDYNIRAIEDLDKKQEIINNNIAELIEQSKRLDARLLDAKDCRAAYGVAVDILYEESIGKLKSNLNSALQYIIFDKNYEVDLVLSDKRGSKSLSISLIDKDTNMEAEVKDGVGNGVRTILSFVLKMYYLMNKNSRILFLDEKYSALSEEYVERFFEFARELCDSEDFILVLITHDQRFTPYANKVYRVSDGQVMVVK